MQYLVKLKRHVMMITLDIKWKSSLFVQHNIIIKSHLQTQSSESQFSIIPWKKQLLIKHKQQYINMTKNKWSFVKCTVKYDKKGNKIFSFTWSNLQFELTILSYAEYDAIELVPGPVLCHKLTWAVTCPETQTSVSMAN